MNDTKEKDFQLVANEYATGVIESMREDLDALAHAQECTGRDDCLLYTSVAPCALLHPTTQPLEPVPSRSSHSLPR